MVFIPNLTDTLNSYGFVLKNTFIDTKPIKIERSYSIPHNFYFEFYLNEFHDCHENHFINETNNINDTKEPNDINEPNDTKETNDINEPNDINETNDIKEYYETNKTKESSNTLDELHLKDNIENSETQTFQINFKNVRDIYKQEYYIIKDYLECLNLIKEYITDESEIISLKICIQKCKEAFIFYLNEIKNLDNKLIDLDHNKLIDLDDIKLIDLDNNKLIDLDHNKLIDLDNKKLIDKYNKLIDIYNKNKDCRLEFSKIGFNILSHYILLGKEYDTSILLNKFTELELRIQSEIIPFIILINIEIEEVLIEFNHLQHLIKNSIIEVLNNSIQEYFNFTETVKIYLKELYKIIKYSTNTNDTKHINQFIKSCEYIDQFIESCKYIITQYEKFLKIFNIIKINIEKSNNNSILSYWYSRILIFIDTIKKKHVELIIPEIKKITKLLKI